MDERLSGISCFSGIGGLDLAIQEDVRTVCYIEWDSYCQKVLQKRAEEGWLDVAPIWDDITTFDGKPWRGKCDILFGGFPCQDISNAGKGAGIREGETRSGLFYEMVRLASEIRPQYVFLENVSAITRRGLDTVLGCLVKEGYDAEWLSLSAAEVGARHKRERWFCLATLSNTPSIGFSAGRCIKQGGDLFSQKRQTKKDEQAGSGRQRGIGAVCEDTDLAYTKCFGCVDGQSEEQPAKGGKQTFSKFISNCWKQDPADLPITSESFVGRVAHGVSKRVDKLKCLGNAVVPLQGRTAWRMLRR